jgi:Fic family protein
MRKTGTYQTLGGLNYFIPYPLPPVNPALELNIEIMSLYGEASFALGQLNEMSIRLSDPKRFIKAYVIKEGLLSSAIEGIHTTLIDIFTHPLGSLKASKETKLVLNYAEALDAALHMLKCEGFPLVTRVILRAHEALLSAGDGEAAPGNFRKQSVRVGDFVPPPAPEVPKLMGLLENYINRPISKLASGEEMLGAYVSEDPHVLNVRKDPSNGATPQIPPGVEFRDRSYEPSEMPPLIRAGLVHIHFETIHPFLDGNGRIGRLLIVLMLIDSGLLNLPILYPSYYFKKHHFEYYQRLDRVRTHGDFEGWISYYLKAIRDSAIDALTRAKEIKNLEIKLKALIKNAPNFVKMRETGALALEFLFTQPITTIAEMSQKLGKAYNTVQNILNEFIKLELVSENIIHKRNKLYRFEVYMNLLEKNYSY